MARFIDKNDLKSANVTVNGDGSFTVRYACDGVPTQRYDYLIVGAGLFGLTVAQQITERCGKNVLIIDRRSRIGGNAASHFDEETGIEIHEYGAHLFHTNIERVWEYANRFTKFTDYTHRVYATHGGEVYPLPINLGTINQFFHAHYTPAEAKAEIERQAGEYADIDPKNLDEQGKKLIGKPLFDAFIRDYTSKQWQTDATELPADIITRLPVRFNYDNRYFTAAHEGLPKDGYDQWFMNMSASQNIAICLDIDYQDDENPVCAGKTLGLVNTLYTGPIDRLFDYSHGELGWRTVDFDEVRYDEKDHFGCPVMNFSDKDVKYTRGIEFKNFNPERSDVIEKEKTVVWYERSRFAERGDEPYYPINSETNAAILEKYKDDVADIDRLTVGGRLGDYKYFDMDRTLDAALNAADSIVENLRG